MSKETAGPIGRRGVLKLAAAGSAALGMPAVVRAADFPAHAITMINPYSTGGYVDNIARVVAPYLGKAIGQPVTVVNVPGADGMLGHEYILKQPDDGYFQMADSVVSIVDSIIMQNAPYKITDFQMINLPARDYTLMCAPKGTTLTSAHDVVNKLKADPTSLSIGTLAAQPDYVNLVIFLRALDIPVEKLRLVTYNGGGECRSAVVGGVVDVGFAGGLGFLPLADQITPLLTFDKTRQAPFNSPTVAEANFGVPISFVAGSLRGFATTASFKAKHPDRYQIVIDAYKKCFNDPAMTQALQTAQLATGWYGPDDSQAIYLQTAQLLQANANLLTKGKSKKKS